MVSLEIGSGFYFDLVMQCGLKFSDTISDQLLILSDMMGNWSDTIHLFLFFALLALISVFIYAFLRVVCTELTNIDIICLLKLM